MKKLILICFVLSVTLCSKSVNADYYEGLVAYYPFNGNARDEINEYHGSIMPSVIKGAILAENRFGEYSSCYKFDGTNDWINIDVLDDAFDGSNTNFSFSGWFKTTDKPSNVYGNVIFVANKYMASGSAENVFRIGVEDKGRIFLSYNDNTHYEYGSGYNDGNWHFLVVSIDSTGVVYCSVDSQRISGFPNGIVDLNLADKFSIGQDWDEKSNSDFWNGYLDDIRIYSRVLSETEIDQLKNENENNCYAQYNEGYKDGKQSCISEPASCGIEGMYTEEDMLNMVNKLLE